MALLVPSMAGRTTERGDAVEEMMKLEPSDLLSQEDSTSTRGGSASLFSFFVNHCSKLPVNALLAEEHFDAEQIWSQVELVHRPIQSSLRRKVKQLEHVAPVVIEAEVKEKGREEEEKEEDGGEGDGEDERNDGDREEVKNSDDDDDGDNEGEEEGDEKKKTWKGNGVEDRFLKINELEEYLEDDEAREYGVQRNKEKTKWNAGVDDMNKNVGMDEDDEEEDEDYADLDLNIGDDEDAKDERYEDFFGGETKNSGKRKGGIKEKKGLDGSEDPLSNEEENNGMYIDTQDGGALSTHEKELLKMQSKIHEMEKANLDPKMWTMQGEVTANKRPKNSALEVDLDFEHNVRPPPVITEEVTASIEDLIKKRIIEGHFDDVQRAPDLPLRVPKVFTEMDETKSKKGLAEIYEEEYAQKMGLSTAPLSSSDEKKKEV
ncbi:hypothetical protein KSP39_PZI010719 [Platanthera zijinensis]|uniref:Uncharacterized protein n=1 Tax=Platanthera zijinensis TaxID=2320716 RepID=A0AAP0BIW5_9ASPA